jgi:alpha-tubulin suppressor-like RCC1 family protein
VYTSRIAAAFAPLVLASCAVFLGLDDHDPYPDDGGAADGSDASGEQACGDTQTDPANCGACGKRCATGYACLAGVCGNRVDAVSAGSHACALLHGGEVWCWGPNTVGQLGVRTPACTTCPTPARVPGITGAVEVSIGINSTCARTGAGAVLCWGEGDAEQLGPDAGVSNCAGNVPCTGTPQSIPLPRAATHVATGEPYACAALDDQSVYCWGDNTFGELGNGAPGSSHGTPVKVSIEAKVVEIAAGRGRPATCVVKTDGTVWCWGVNDRGLLGHAGAGDLQCDMPRDNPCNPTPSPIAAFTGFSAPTVSQIACATTSGTVYCWGANGNAQLGLGSPDTVDHPTPAPVAVATPTRIAPGLNHTCALDATGQVSCWGYNLWGVLGDGTIGGPATCENGQVACQPNASHVTGLPKIVGLAAGAEFNVALGEDGSVWAWGLNTDGRIGHSATQADAGDQPCFIPGVNGGPCSPKPSRVLGLP